MPVANDLEDLEEGAKMKQHQQQQRREDAVKQQRLTAQPITTTSSSRQWSSESLLADHKEVQATAMAVDATGQMAVLGAKKMLALIPLNRENKKLGVFTYVFVQALSSLDRNAFLLKQINLQPLSVKDRARFFHSEATKRGN